MWRGAWIYQAYAHFSHTMIANISIYLLWGQDWETHIPSTTVPIPSDGHGCTSECERHRTSLDRWLINPLRRLLTFWSRYWNLSTVKIWWLLFWGKWLTTQSMQIALMKTKFCTHSFSNFKGIFLGQKSNLAPSEITSCQSF